MGAERSNITGLTVKLLFADNTTRIVSVDEDYEAGINANSKGVLVGYSINDEGIARLYTDDDNTATDDADITLTEVPNAGTITYTESSKTLSATGFNRTVTASGSIAFLSDSKGEWAAYSVDALESLTATADNNGLKLYTATKNNRVVAFAFDLEQDVAGAGGDDLYGWVLDDATSRADYQTLPVWNGEETIEVRFDSKATLTNVKGTFVKIEKFNAEKEYAAGDLKSIAPFRRRWYYW